MTFFSLGDHHNFAILEVGLDAEKNFEGIGVDHFAFKLNGGIFELAVARQELKDAGVKVLAVDHNVTYSLNFVDPDDNKLEIYVDGVSGWQDDPSLILSEAKLLKLPDNS